VLTVGSGPFPDYGIGWEAGYKAAYFGGYRIIAAKDSLPNPSQLASLMIDLKEAHPDAILVWGEPKETQFSVLVSKVASQYPCDSFEAINDPAIGTVGMLFFPLDNCYPR
jgi:hypothetical protein